MAERKTKKQPNRVAKKREKRSTLPDPEYPKTERVPRKVGRPSTCTQAVRDEARWYIQGGWRLVGDAIPSAVGLACELEVSESQLYDWASINDDFSEILKGVKDEQHRALLNGGASGKLNSTITKLILGKHGYSEKVDSTLSNPDGSMRQQPTTITIQGRRPGGKHDNPRKGWGTNEDTDD